MANRWRICDVCNGTGKRKEGKIGFFGVKMVDVDCFACYGKGELLVPASDTCDAEYLNGLKNDIHINS
jgi:DnaJ-class molecular chaperone